jgi:hypothetical protein
MLAGMPWDYAVVWTDPSILQHYEMLMILEAAFLFLVKQSQNLFIS